MASDLGIALPRERGPRWPRPPSWRRPTVLGRSFVGSAAACSSLCSGALASRRPAGVRAPRSFARLRPRPSSRRNRRRPLFKTAWPVAVFAVLLRRPPTPGRARAGSARARWRIVSRGTRGSVALGSPGLDAFRIPSVATITSEVCSPRPSRLGLYSRASAASNTSGPLSVSRGRLLTGTRAARAPGRRAHRERLERVLARRTRSDVIVRAHRLRALVMCRSSAASSSWARPRNRPRVLFSAAAPAWASPSRAVRASAARALNSVKSVYRGACAAAISTPWRSRWPRLAHHPPIHAANLRSSPSSRSAVQGLDARPASSARRRRRRPPPPPPRATGPSTPPLP